MEKKDKDIKKTSISNRSIILPLVTNDWFLIGFMRYCNTKILVVVLVCSQALDINIQFVMCKTQ